MSVKIVYKDVAVGAAEDASVSSASANSISTLDSLPLGAAAPPVANLELNGWGLSGDFEIYDGQDIGFWSKDLSDENGAFPTPPSIRVDFEAQYTSLGIFLEFGANVDEWPTDIVLRWYQGDTLLSEKSFCPDAPTYFCENTVEAYDAVTLTINSTHLPYHRARVARIVFGVQREFEIDELRQVHIQQEIDPSSAQLAVNTMEWTLDSREAVDYIFQNKQPVEALDGDNLIGVFYIDSSKRLSERVYEVSCIDAVGVLDESDFTATMYSGKNAKELILEILNGDFLLDMDSSFDSATVTGLIQDGTRREALQQIAFAIGAVVDTSASDKVLVYPLASSGENEIPRSRVYVGGDVEQTAKVTAVKVTAHTYTAGDSGDDIVEVGGKKYVHTTSMTVIENPNVTASDKPNVVEVKEATLVNTSNAAAVAQRVYNDALRRNTLNGRIVMKGEKTGDFVTFPTPFSTALSGNIISMSISLSGIAAADVTVRGA